MKIQKKDNPVYSFFYEAFSSAKYIVTGFTDALKDVFGSPKPRIKRFRMRCEKCGSFRLKFFNYRYAHDLTKAGYDLWSCKREKAQVYQCQDCTRISDKIYIYENNKTPK